MAMNHRVSNTHPPTAKIRRAFVGLNRPMLRINEQVMYGSTVICRRPTNASPKTCRGAQNSPKKSPHPIPPTSPIRILTERLSLDLRFASTPLSVSLLTMVNNHSFATPET